MLEFLSLVLFTQPIAPEIADSGAAPYVGILKPLGLAVNFESKTVFYVHAFEVAI
jgi:hypothetical protein